MEKLHSFIEAPVLCTVLGMHWASLNVSLADKEDLLHIGQARLQAGKVVTVLQSPGQEGMLTFRLGSCSPSHSTMQTHGLP